MDLQLIEQHETWKGLVLTTYYNFAYVTDETSRAWGNLVTESSSSLTYEILYHVSYHNNELIRITPNSVSPVTTISTWQETN